MKGTPCTCDQPLLIGGEGAELLCSCGRYIRPRGRLPLFREPAASATGWKMFMDTGMLWWINRILHTYGWAIAVYEDDKNGTIVQVAPKRVTCLGFPRDVDKEKLAAFQKFYGPSKMEGK